MCWKTLKSPVAMVVLCVGAGWILSQGLAWGIGTCNTKKVKNGSAEDCDVDYADSTWCSHSSRQGSESGCETQLGADGSKGSGAGSWYQECEEGGENSNHCVLNGKKCLQKYDCVYDDSDPFNDKPCQADSEHTPEAWWYTNEATSPDCVVGGS